jgi:palmitoyltransferase ZDHHC9/14/18
MKGYILCVLSLAAVKYIHALLILTVTREDHPFLEAVKDSQPSVSVGVVCFFSVWSVLGLAGFHTYLTTSNQTTNEDVSIVHILRYCDLMTGVL